MELLLIIFGFILVILGSAWLYVSLVSQQKGDYDKLVARITVLVKSGLKSPAITELIKDAREYECADLDMLEDLENEWQLNIKDK